MKKAKAPGVFSRLKDLYARMEAAYRESAAAAGLSCAGCADNCCVTHFQHHTHVEWAYLWKGMMALPAEQRERYLARARANAEEARRLTARGLRPRLMCPVNDDGLCGLYGHRLMICRMHGAANRLVRADGESMLFPGCGRYAELATRADAEGRVLPVLDRTPFYRELAALEVDYLKRKKAGAAKVDLTLAEMLAYGPPKH